MASSANSKKLALLDAFAAMYSSRIQVAQDYAKRHIRVATVATVAVAGRIVPDMRVEYLERDDFLSRVDTLKGGVPGAVAMIDGAEEGEVPFGLIFDDGDALMMRMRIHRLDRDE